MTRCRGGVDTQSHRSGRPALRPIAATTASLTEAKRLLDADPATAVVLARRVLAVAPGNTEARFVVGAALRRDGQPDAALAALEPLAVTLPGAWGIHHELGLTLTALGQAEAAARAQSRAVAANPDSSLARHALAVALYRLDRHQEALAAIDPLVEAQPATVAFRALRAAIRMQLGDADGAIADYAAAIAVEAGDAHLHHGHGHALKAIGRQDEAVAAYRRATELRPGFGEAWWSLANLKTWRFATDDIDRMETLLGAEATSIDSRAYLGFALGKALEDAGDHAAAFAHYAAGNAARRAATPYDASAAHALVARTIATFDAAFFAERAGVGAPDTDPIFIVGMPRSGSTLVEQILASHGEVEGASELPDIPAIARRLATDGGSYPEAMATRDHREFAALGRDYLDRTRILRRLGRAYFVDKLPGNFVHIGLIHLMLPNARIVDVRRHPLACCVSLFKQAFAHGQSYADDLGDLGRAYADYVALTAHFDRVLPGRVLRVDYEALIDDPEGQIRRLLGHCRLDFDPACLRFFDTPRVIRTPSAQQVRQPIFRDGLDQWRHFEPWLGPLRAALGEIGNPG